MSATASLRYLLDTNIFSELARLQPHAGVLRQVQQWQAQSAMAATTAEELVFGISRLPAGKRKTLYEQWLESIFTCFAVLPYDDKAALWLGLERARLQAKGLTVSRPDGEIAAVAITQGLTLVTRNVPDFRHIQALRIENWFAAG